jgi:hypothetical protein
MMKPAERVTDDHLRLPIFDYETFHYSRPWALPTTIKFHACGVNTHLSGERVLVNTHMKNFLDNLSNSGQAVRLYGEGRH